MTLDSGNNLSFDGFTNVLLYKTKQMFFLNLEEIK